MDPNGKENINLHYVGDNHDFEDWAREVIYKTNTLVTEKIQRADICLFDFFLKYVPTDKEGRFEPYYVFCFEYNGDDDNIKVEDEGFGISANSIKPFFNGYYFNKGYTKSASINRASFFCFNCISDWFKEHYGE